MRTCWPREAAVGDMLVVKCWLCECPSMGPDSPAVKSATNRLEEPRKEFPGTPPRSCWWSHWRIYDTLLNKIKNNVWRIRFTWLFVHRPFMHFDIYKKKTQKMAGLWMRCTTFYWFCCDTNCSWWIMGHWTLNHLDLGFGWTKKPSEGIVFVPIRFLMSEMADIIDVLRVYIVTAVTELLYCL